jgi:peptidoglycan pentaglycine glycine transferase (the first glycine)
MSNGAGFEADRWNAKQWDDLASRFPSRSIYQLGLYAEMHSCSRFRSYSRAAVMGTDGCADAMLQIRVKRPPFVKGGVADGEWGPLWKDLDSLSSLLSGLRREYVEKRSIVLRMTPVSTYSESLDREFVQCLREEGFQRNPHVRAYLTVVIDLSRSLDDIRAGFHQKWRNQLNVAERAGLRHESGTSDEFFERFLRIYEQMWKDKKFPTGVRVPIIRRMHCSLPDAQKLLITIVKDGDTDLGATVCAACGNSLLYFLGATMPGLGTEARPGYLLQWLHIEKAKQLGLRWYDLGGYDDNVEDIARFKKRTNGVIVQFPGQFECSPKVGSSIVYSVAEQLYRRSRKLVTGR